MKVYIKNYEDKKAKLEGKTVYIPVLVVEVDGKYIQMDDCRFLTAVVENDCTDFQIIKDLIPHPFVEISGK